VTAGGQNDIWTLQKSPREVSKVHGLGEDIGAGGWRWKICGI